MTLSGFEKSSQSPRKSQIFPEHYAESYAAGHDPDLARLVELWPTLPEATRQSIMELIESVDA
jgi:hypothetical protein